MSLLVDEEWFDYDCPLDEVGSVLPGPRAESGQIVEQPTPETSNRAPDDGVLLRHVAAVAEQSRAALGELYDATVDRVYGLALAITRSADDAEDVVSEVYLRVWHSASQYQPSRGSVNAWLTVVCRSLALDLLRRKRAVHRKTEHLAQHAEEAAVAVGAADLIDLMQRGSAVRQALTELPESQCRLISLAFFQDMSHSEIADAVGLPLGTVKSHIRRGLSHIRKIIEP